MQINMAALVRNLRSCSKSLVAVSNHSKRALLSSLAIQDQQNPPADKVTHTGQVCKHLSFSSSLTLLLSTPECF